MLPQYLKYHMHIFFCHIKPHLTWSQFTSLNYYSQTFHQKLCIPLSDFLSIHLIQCFISTFVPFFVHTTHFSVTCLPLQMLFCTPSTDKQLLRIYAPEGHQIQISPWIFLELHQSTQIPSEYLVFHKYCLKKTWTSSIAAASYNSHLKMPTTFPPAKILRQERLEPPQWHWRLIIVILSDFSHSLTRTTTTGTLTEVGATAGTFLSRKMGS